MIIDFHTHTFPDKIAKRVCDTLGKASKTKYYIEPTTENLSLSAKAAGVDFCVNLPVMTRVDQVTSVNDKLIKDKDELLQKGIITFGGLHPDFSDYKSELIRLRDNGIKGIKLHPAYQNTDLDDIKYLRIIDAASMLGLITLTHAGLDVGIPKHNFASVPMILKVINEVKPEKFVLAHMGSWNGFEYVEKEIAGAPVYLDTSFSLGRITPRDGMQYDLWVRKNMDEEQFVRLCKKHGTNKILFATDSPWSDQMEYIEFVNMSTLNAKEKKDIFENNARRLLKI